MKDHASEPLDLTVDALGVPIGVGRDAPSWVRHLARTVATPLAVLRTEDLPDPVRALTRIAVERTDLLCVHAGVVGLDGGAIVFPGASGAGKSTLTGACVRAGMDYLCDEVLAVDRVTSEAVPFARPLALSAGSRRLLGVAGASGLETFVDPAELGTVAVAHIPVRHIVIPHRRPGPATLTPIGAPDVLKLLLTRSFNHFRDPTASWRLLTGVSARAGAWEARYEDARELAALVSSRLRATAAV